MAEYSDIFINALKGYANYFVGQVMNPAWDNYFYWLIAISLFFWSLELLFPWRTKQGAFRKDFWLDSFYMFFNFFLFSLIGFAAVSTVVSTAFNDLILKMFGWSNLVAINVAKLPAVVQMLILFVVKDFIQWNVHRMLHYYNWMWEFHKVHHSVEEMGFAAHLRFHWMENVIYRTCEYIPLSMIGFGIQDFIFVHLFTLAWGHFNHTNINLPLGWLKYIFNSPQMHLWHHAEHIPNPRGVNFGITLSVWDYLFKTTYMPNENPNEPLGFENLKEFPKTFLGQSFYPFNK